MATTISPIRIPIIGVDSFTKELNRAGSKIQGMGRKMRSVGKGLSIGLTAPIVGFGAAAVKASLDFDKAMANVGTLIPGQRQRLESLSDTVEDLSVEVGKSAQDISGGLFQVISAFGDTADTEKILAINSRAAVAGVSTVADSINLTSAVTKAFGDTTAEANQKVIDMAFLANKLGQTTFPELAGALPRVTALSEKLGVSQEEMFAVMATATGVTGNTAEVATQFRGVLGSLIKPTDDMQKALQKLGFSSGEALIKEKGLSGALESVKGLADKYGKSLGDLIGEKNALALAFSLTGAQSEKFATSLEAMGNASGAANEAFKEQTEGANETGFTLAQTRQEINKLMRAYGDQLLPVVLDFAKAMRPVIQRLSDMSPKTMRNITVALGLAAALGPVIAAFGQLTIVVGGAMKLFSSTAFLGAMSKIGPVLKGSVLGPVGLTIAAFLVWANVIRQVIDGWDELTYAFSSAKNFTKTISILFGGKGYEEQTEDQRAAAIMAARQELRERRGGGSSERTQVDVNFRNPPAGTRAEVVQGSGVNTSMEMGQLAAAGNG